MSKPHRGIIKNQNTKPRHHMKNTIIKSLAAILLMAGITQAQAGVVETIRKAVAPPRPPHTPTAVAAVRG